MDLKNKKFVFLGDSITEGYYTSVPEKMYVNVFKNMTGAICYNHGICGTRIARQQTPTPSPCERFDKYFVSRVEELEPDADFVIVFGGTNDYGHGDAPIGNINDHTVDTFYGAFKILLEKLIEKYPSSNIICITPIHRITENALVNKYGKPVQGPLKTYVEIEKEICLKYHINVLDAYNICPIDSRKQSDLEKYYSPDGLHPYDEGHRVIAETLYKYILENY